MQCVELNPVGNFDTWEFEKIEELLHQEISESLGEVLVFENESVKLWDLSLDPGKRVPFRNHNTNYSWVCATGGLALTHFGNGKISMLQLEPGETEYWEFRGKNYTNDLQNIGESPLTFNILEYKEESVGKSLLFMD
ncbi:hypothetical protein LV716_15675 [Flagellimonas sp. HMM57]|uniref:hypothetical protein n=1 Tax=unclassified Flagellimonas TaxID=2644544 RepID=UPI0013D55BB9|nr:MULTISPECIES: hypothetical protein [unclassified Flagellimonas]UII75681.1 hypothetical protein LV716_15675 [Flagellimonas sp. HMM57]